MELDKENVVQAVVLGDAFNNNFYPISREKSLALLPMVGVPLIDFVLESLAQGGVGETILFCCQDVHCIKDHIKKCIEKKASWSLTMDVHVKTSDSCLTMGDAMREIDASGIIKGPFILTGVNTISNIPYAALLEQHKQTCKKDKGAAMTILYKKVSWGHDLINFDHTIFLAADGRNNKVLMHQKYKPKCDDETKTINLPLETVLNHSEVKLFHNLIDANIALCSPSVPPLFSDNFDFQSKDDFIHGILINEEILQSSLYYMTLKGNHYAASVSNWKTYQRISRDVLHHWAFPLSIETGNFSKDNHIFMGDHCYRHKDAKLMFLQEVIDSLARGYEEKLKCDYLILEINSSRYAYNILLHEVNFYVVRALLSMPALTENKNILNELKGILKYFKPILSNYIKSKSSIMDCLRAVEDSCFKCEWLEGRAGQVIHLLYDFDIIDEDSLTTWYNELKENNSPIANQPSLTKFFAWLQEASEESDDSN